MHRGGSKSFQEHKRELVIKFINRVYILLQYFIIRLAIILIYFQAARYNREPTMAELFKATHAVERTDEEGNVSYEWTDDKSQSVMVN